MIPKSLAKIARMLNLKKRASYVIGMDIGISSMKVVGMQMGDRQSISFYSIVNLPKDYNEKYITDAIQKILKEHNFPQETPS